MKKVVTGDMVCHLWANQSQDEARNAQGNLYFNGDTIYSYGTHFPMAKILSNGTVLLTTRCRSNTTAKHLHMVRLAVRHLPMIECFDPTPIGTRDHHANLKDMRDRCTAALTKAAHARTYAAMHMRDAESCVQNHAAYRAYFGEDLDAILVIPESWKQEAQTRIAAQQAQNKEHKAQQAAREALNNAARLADLEEWKIDHQFYIRDGFRDLPVALRLMRTNPDVQDDHTIIQTSWGAEIPVDHAQRIWKKVQTIRTTGIPYRHNGHTEHAGVFTIDSIDTHGTLKAGCHTITFEAMHELAERLGWS